MTTGAYAAYAKAAVRTTENKEKILLKLYEGARRFIRFARIGMEANKPAIRGENIAKVIAILSELNCALDTEAGGEVAANLSGLYQYMILRLTHANTTNDSAALDEVETLLVPLHEAFETVVANISLSVPEEAEALEKVS